MKQPHFFNCITYSHPYWGRKQSVDFHNIFKGMKSGDVLIDPFCGNATPIITAIQYGAKVFAGDTNPVTVFLLKVLIQPVGLYALREAFEEIQNNVAENIQNRYSCTCPQCKKKINFEYLKWVKKGSQDRPESFKVTCRNCGFNRLKRLSKREIQRQLSESKVQPEYWYPRKKIKVSEKKDTIFIQELFTQRNLASLAELLNAINKIKSARCRETLQYVFTAILNSCITIQNQTGKFHTASCRPDESGCLSPSIGQEKNIWNVFKKQFTAMITCKAKLNSLFGITGFSNSMDEFLTSDFPSYISIADLLSFSFPRKLKITHVFIDPPYNSDSGYSALLELWGSWLKMNFADTLKWQFEEYLNEEYIQKLQLFLLRIRKNTDPSCKIILAHRIKNPEVWEALCGAFTKIGYEASAIGTNFFDVPQKPNQKRHVVPDHYYSLTPKSQTVNELSTTQMNNRMTYNQTCLSLIHAILLKDNYEIKSILNGSFYEATPDINQEAFDFKIHDSRLGHVDFIAEGKEGRKIFFCFYSPEKEEILKKTAEDVFKKDKHEFQVVCYLIFPNRSLMKSFRHTGQADKWPRGFYICFEDICKKAAEINPNQFGHLINMEPKKSTLKNKHRIKHCNAEVIENTPVGFDGKPMHFKLQFTAPDIHNIGPGQFVMIDTLPVSQRKKHSLFYQKQVSENRKQLTSLSARSFLKRPFGIQRAYYEYFEWGYHKKLQLPAQLASITNTVYPHKFEIFYKIIENGTGTNELKKLQPGSRIKILGPLGRFVNIPKWRSHNIDEVHLIGGGVGMAPLIFFGQALKFYSFNLRAFIGIDRIESLKETPYGKTFADESEKAYVYINELSKIGLNPDEIFLSRESVNTKEKTVKEISRKNYHVGLVTDQYKQYISRLKRTGSFMILACGPKPMLTALNHIALQFNIPMKVLLEKRMGCGIGVCMSCVCRTKKSSERSRYSRVCVEGPLFDAAEIDWKKL